MEYMSVKEFRELGYLQELNRQFLHPLGLALEVVVDDDGNESFGGVWDCRNDEDGIIYDLKNSDEDRKNKFIKKQKFIESEWFRIGKLRQKKLGYNIEPIERS
jgi:hypothetical protein